MTAPCSHCGGSGKEPDAIERIRAWCERNGHWVSWDDRVTEAAAADILGRQPKTLRNWANGAGPALPRRKNAAGAVTYRIVDLVRLMNEAA